MIDYTAQQIIILNFNCIYKYLKKTCKEVNLWDGMKYI